MRRILRAGTLLIPVLVAATSVAGGVVFQDLSVRKALAQAETEGKLVLLYYTTTWCAPCRVMEATTFEDPEVAAWVAEHTVAVKVDGDLGRAGRYDKRSYPAVVYVDADGTAVDRILGLVDSADFLFVGANVLAGKYGTAPARQRAKQTGPRQTQRCFGRSSRTSQSSVGIEGPQLSFATPLPKRVACAMPRSSSRSRPEPL